MEDSKLDRFKSGTKRLFGRTNERLKQKMGRSSDTIVTKDDKWQVLVANFNRQQTAAFKLHREVKGYIASLKTMESSTQTLLDAVREMHEYTWPGNMSLVKALQGLDKLNKELNEAMLDSLLVPVNNYVEIFPHIRERMIKRERKLLDYTRSKRSLDSLKKGEKISPEKLGLAQDDYTQNKMIYEEVNSELCDDLPELWNSRKTYILKFLETFFKQSADFHKEFTQVYGECASSLEPLKEQIRNDPPPQREIGNIDKFFLVSDNARRFKRQSLRKSMRKSGGSFKRSLSMGAIKKKKVDNKDSPQSMSNLSVDPYVVPAQQANVYTPTKVTTVKKTSPQRPKPPRAADNVAAAAVAEPGAPFSPSIKVEPGTKVECIHVYKAVDEDELSFVTGDVVTVVEWDSSDEQDEGWFMGLLEGSGAKGAFPINYTRRFTNPIVEEEEEEEVFHSTNGLSRQYDNAPGTDELDMTSPDGIEVNLDTSGAVDLDTNGAVNLDTSGAVNLDTSGAVDLDTSGAVDLDTSAVVNGEDVERLRAEDDAEDEAGKSLELEVNASVSDDVGDANDTNDDIDEGLYTDNGGADISAASDEVLSKNEETAETSDAVEPLSDADETPLDADEALGDKVEPLIDDDFAELENLAAARSPARHGSPVDHPVDIPAGSD